MITVRTCRPEHFPAALAPIWHYFGRAPTESDAARFAEVLPADRMHAAFDGDAIVGGAGAFPFEMAVPGGRVSAAGVTVVGVLPSHRRRGVLREMMRAQLDGAREWGTPIAALWASEATIYGRFGYGLASLAGSIELARERAALGERAQPVGSIRLVAHDEALAHFPAVYDRVFAETPGMTSRSPQWWSSRRLLDLPERRNGGGELVRALLELDGRPAAYALYRHFQAWEHGSSAGWIEVLEAMGDSPVATREIWRFLLETDWIATLRARLLPVDHPLFLLLAEPRRMRFTVMDGLWVRLVDVPAALAARSYRAGEPVVLELRDEFCPWNARRWRVGGPAGVEATGDAPDLALDVGALGSIYLGGFTFAQLSRALRVDELRESAIDRADAIFATNRAPWCPEIF